MRRGWNYLLAGVAVIALGGCAKNYESMEPGSRIYYGDLTYIPEVKGGKFEHSVVSSSDVESKDANDYIDGMVQVCVSSSESSQPLCQGGFKNKTIFRDTKDVTAPGVLNLDEKDSFAFIAKPGESLKLIGFKVRDYTFMLHQGMPLEGVQQANYLGNITLRLKHTGSFQVYDLEATVNNYYERSAPLAYTKYKIPMNVPSGLSLLNLEGAQYRVSRTIVTQQPMMVPMFIPRGK